MSNFALIFSLSIYNKTLLLWFCCFIFISAHVNADSNYKLQNEQQGMVTLLKDIYAQFNELPVEQSDSYRIPTIFSSQCDFAFPKSYQKQALLADAERFERDWGFEFRGRFSHNIAGTSLNNVAGDDGGVNSPPGFVELSWDILRDGYFANRGRAQSLHKEAQLAEIDNQVKIMNNDFRCRRYKLAQNFTGFSAHILSLRLVLMESISSVERRAYFKGWSQFDELLVSEDELTRIRHELRYLHGSPYFDKQITNLFNPPLIDIDMQKLAVAIRDDTLQPQIINLKKDILESRESAHFNNRVRLFVREGLVRDDRFGQGVGARVGVSFSIPLTIKKEDPLKYRLLEVDSQAELESWERLERVRHAYSLVKSQQKQVIKQHYRYQRAAERFRSSFVSLRLDFDDDNDLVIAITRLRTLLDTAFELIEVKKELYWRINEVLSSSGVAYQPNFITLYKLPAENKRGREKNRLIYTWSKSFNIISNPDIFDFVRAKGINKILLSAGKKTHKDKMSLFLYQAEKNNFDVEMILGSNQWIFPENHQRAATSSLIAAEKYGAIHFDIEPQAFDDFKQRTRYYLENYVSMLTTIRQKIPTHPLTVAVPLHWPIEFYEQTEQLVDGIYIMAYNTKAETLIRRLQPIVQQLDKDKITIILRLKNFNDEWALEQLIDQLSRSLGINKFGFENLSGFITLAGQQQ